MSGQEVRINGQDQWVISPTYKWGMNWGYNPLILTIDPNFQPDIQASYVGLFDPSVDDPKGGATARWHWSSLSNSTKGAIQQLRWKDIFLRQMRMIS